MAKIVKIIGRQILDSRGNPTVEADVFLEDGSMGRASVPSGASTGDYEAVELRDGDQSKYGGKSVLKAVGHVNNEIAHLLTGMDASEQRRLDEAMIRADGTKNKANFGANAILAVSLAAAVAESKSRNLELYEYLSVFSPKQSEPFVLPHAMMNVINGGKHAIKSADFQEYMIMPMSQTSFAQRLEDGTEIFQHLKKLLDEAGYQTLVGDEGGFAPSLSSNAEPLDYIMKAIEKAGFRPVDDVAIAMDPASSEFFSDGTYTLHEKLDRETTHHTREEMIDFYEDLVNRYPIISIEDPLEQNDFEGWNMFTERLGKRIQVVGDDFYATNVERLQKGIDMRASNSILIKLNQIGSLSETIDAINLAHRNGMSAIVSHRSGETEDTFIADLVVAMRTGQIKTGSLSRSERLAKYNRLLRIEERIRGGK